MKHYSETIEVSTTLLPDEDLIKLKKFLKNNHYIHRQRIAR